MLKDVKRILGRVGFGLQLRCTCLQKSRKDRFIKGPFYRKKVHCKQFLKIMKKPIIFVAYDVIFGPTIFCFCLLT